MSSKKELIRKIVLEVREFCATNASDAQARKYARFFTEGYDAYGIPKEIWDAQKTRFYEKYKDRLTVTDFMDLGDLLFESGKYEEAGVAILSVEPMLARFNCEAFQRVGRWLEQGVRNWAHSDIICSLLLGPCLKNGTAGLADLSDWRTSPSRWKRRAVPVSMLELLKENEKVPGLLKFVEPLMLDPERVVHQGMGWFLREAWKKDPGPVEKFLLKYKDQSPRLIFQYATEKMSSAERERFRKTKK